jgi:DNA-binding NarL/FixJ family response regulator
VAPLIRILLVEDEALVRRGVAELLSRQPDLRVVADVATSAAALDVLDDGPQIDVVVADVMLEGRPAGLELLAEVGRRPAHPPVLLLSSYGEPWMYGTALRAGALGYVLKGGTLDELTSAIRNVAAGVAVFPTAALRDRHAGRLPSPREREIMGLVADGMANGEIGARLGISDRTVESHLARLFARYDVGSRTELALLAAHQGWIGARTIGPT